MGEPLRLSTRSGDVPAGRVPLFYIDDVEYTIPDRVSANVALKYMRMVRVSGVDAASAWLLEEVLGDDAYTALMNYDGLTVTHLEQIGRAINDLVMGATEVPKGKR